MSWQNILMVVGLTLAYGGIIAGWCGCCAGRARPRDGLLSLAF